MLQAKPEHIELLRSAAHKPVPFVAPDSNFLPMLQLSRIASPGNAICDGEHILEAYRAGWLTISDAEDAEIRTVPGGDLGPFGEIPDIEARFRYALTPMGRAILELAHKNDQG